ncbi:DNA topoisomerase IV [Flavobacterium sp.]|uniref:DNA topoisomerase IV n=1 Tax=Flavobacterium sp. TaxID=239 RepID=UPI00286B4508|nr:DNA topoisomerase IV [Flavobacterium sp.]
MKKITVLLLVLNFVSCYKVEHNCNDFKTGKFKFTQEIKGEKKTSTFERTENLQIETFDGKTDTASIRWVGECEFVLEKLHPKNMQEKKAISMKIISTKNKTYIFEYSFVGNDQKQRGTVTKLN